ncbi:MAG: hypothetical protein HYZ10_11205, partial [Ignavibacteriales bacterium]|nr:hypothetical protein [Ignavibacteriales bacterium]
MKNLVGFLILILGLGSITAQSYNKRFAVPQNQVQNISSSDTLRILAVMVDFQEDKYDATIGTGKFGSHYTQVYGDTILDPLPHNDEYFADHLLFAKNYFKKVSGGKLNLSYKVLPEVITVSQTMREYVPGYKSTDLSPLGKFSEEVWKLADQKFSNVKFSDYDLFVIFHAGVSSASSIGGGIVNRNMPSLYLSESSLKSIFGTQFQGFSTKTGTISNTVIMSETESREQEFIDGTVGLTQIGINGILVGNIGSHIGLPDLFNTETSISAIGRFGLMDSQALVANNGMFPPSLSPWEKMYLGWEQPKEISLVGGKVNIATRETAAASDTTLLKVPISSQEYYLVENRQQDAKKDNMILTIKKGNQIFKKTFLPDTSGLFNIYPADIKGGVVIDVDEYDASVPGNGIVIWHIDENVINSKIGENKINTDLMYKGVDVEEADGIQDIGESFTSIFQDELIIGEGTYEDFWYKGNKAKFYKNTFSQTSKPNTNSNLGSNSLITLDSFSEPSNKMSFNVAYGNDQTSLIGSINLPLESMYTNLLMLGGPGGIIYYAVSGNDILRIASNGKILWKSESSASKDRLAGITLNGKQYVVSANLKQLSVFFKDYSFPTSGGEWVQIPLPSEISSNIVLSQKNGVLYVTVGLKDGTIYTAEVEKIISSRKPESGSITKYSDEAIGKICKSLDEQTNVFSFSTLSEFFYDAINKKSISIQVNDHILVKDLQGGFLNICLQDVNNTKIFTVIKNGQIVNSFSFPSETGAYKFSVADIFNNGKISILFNNLIELRAYGLNGTMLENFPITIKDKYFVGTPLVADINKDGIQEILAITNGGEIYAFNPATGKVLSGYPLRNGIHPAVNPVLFSEELPTMGPLPS